jgi:hypothetical protein
VEHRQFGRVYRSGDRVRRLPGGTIEFLGRGDGQVKVRGFRVELGEIEQVIRRLPGVQDAVVLPLPDASADDAPLVAYVVPAPASYATAHTERPGPERVRRWLGEQLPAHMVPEHVVLLDALPLTPNGKLDRRALPSPATLAGTVEGPVAPRSATEVALVGIWSETLKRDDVGIRNNFFELGGHSLLAIRVLGKVSRVLGVRLALRTLFESPTIEALALTIDAEREKAAPATQPSPIRAVPRNASPAPDRGGES